MYLFFALIFHLSSIGGCATFRIVQHVASQESPWERHPEPSHPLHIRRLHHHCPGTIERANVDNIIKGFHLILPPQCSFAVFFDNSFCSLWIYNF